MTLLWVLFFTGLIVFLALMLLSAFMYGYKKGATQVMQDVVIVNRNVLNHEDRVKVMKSLRELSKVRLHDT